MRPISLLTAVILPLALAAPVPDKETTPPQIIPITPPRAIPGLINTGLDGAANPTDVAYVTGLIAAEAAQKASGSTSGTTSKRQVPGLGNLDGILDTLGPVVSDIVPGGGGILKRQDLPPVGGLPGVAGLANDLPLRLLVPITGDILQDPTASSLSGGLKERAKRQEVAAALKG